MCGRFTLATPGELVAEVFGLDDVPELAPRYNIAPTQPVAVVRQLGPHCRTLSFLRWGLVPTWSRSPRGRALLFNARAETLAEREAFRSSLERRRCLIPADGFYEWRAVPGSRAKQPYLVRLADERPFALAGLWEGPHPGDPESPGTCTIVTTEPNSLLQPIHDRMPVILDPGSYATWLDPSVRAARPLLALLRPYAAEAMTTTRVGPTVNNAANDNRDCLRSA